MGPQSPTPATPATPASASIDRPYFIERVGEAAVVQVYADGFRDLPLREKTLVWHLTQAAIAGRDIFYDQRYAHNLEMRDVLEAIEREAPERLTVPSGNRVTIQYKAGKRPVLAVRIQEVFGLADTPKVAGGRVKVLMHLLAPNHRPQQVTEDLRSFWNGAYVEVRKELSRRYPRHAWPEDPWNAPPERRPKRRR